MTTAIIGFLARDDVLIELKEFTRRNSHITLLERNESDK
jgi:hypothetical protein